METLHAATVAEALVRRATDTPDALAFAIGDDRLTFGELHKEARWLARRLAASGLQRSERCALLLPSTLDAVRACHACHMIGAAPVAIDPSMTPAMIERRLRRSRPSLILVDTHAGRAGIPHTEARVATLDDLAATVPAGDDCLRASGPDDVAYLQFTTGTMGDPKAAVVSHRALAAALEGMRVAFDLGSDDVVAARAPVHHSTGLVRYVFGTAWFGCPSYLLGQTSSHVEPWLALITRTRATVTNGPDFTFRVAASARPAESLRLDSLRIATTGGEVVRASTIRRFEERFGLERIVQPAYGLSEAALIATSTRPDEPLVTDSVGNVSCGTAMPGVELRIVDGSGRVCANNEPGEITLRGTQVFDGYFGDEASTRAALRDGWLHTGDVGIIDGAGRLFPHARARSLIKRAGVGLAPREFEEPVEQLDGVVGVAAVGVARPDRLTEDVVLVVESAETDGDACALLAIGAERAVADAMGALPVRILVVAPGAIPRSGIGKVRYLDLQRLVVEARFLAVARFVG